MNPRSVNTNYPCPRVVRPLGALSGWQERRAKELMLRDLGNCVRISDIAEHCNLSRSHFSRAFKKVTGHSPQGWLVMMKIEKAKSLLANSNYKIEHIAHLCGYKTSKQLRMVLHEQGDALPAALKIMLS